MLKYIKKLKKAQREELVYLLGFRMLPNGFRCGTSVEERDDYIVYSTWDKDYSSSKDWYSDDLYLSDFLVHHGYNSAEQSKILRKYLYSIFGEKYKEDLKRFLEGQKKEIDKNIENERRKAEQRLAEEKKRKYDSIDEQISELEDL